MGQPLAKLVLLATTLGGCSLLYNPNELPRAADAPPDIAIPPNPDDPLLESVAPSILVEGAGVGGSRPAVLVLTGKNFVPNNLSVSITAADGSTRMIEIDSAKLEVETHGLRIAVPITLPVDDMLRKDQMIELDVKVTQDGSAGPVSTLPLTGKLVLKGLDELRDTTPPTTLTLNGGVVHEYSQIDVATTDIRPAAGQTAPILLRSTSSVKIARSISVDAGAVPACGLLEQCPGGPGGPGGGAGGLGGTITNGAGSAGGGPYAGTTAGNPGRFESTDLGLSTLTNPNRSSGGAGGDGNTLGRGGGGGGGGGSIEISAGGNLEVGAISAHGVDGGPGLLGAQKGGGGSGGVILLRAGGTLKAGDLDVSGGGTAQDGRARYDAGGTAMLSPGELGADHYRGPMFVDPPLITRSKTPDLNVIGKPLTVFRYFIINEAGQSSELFDDMTNGDGTLRVALRQPLDRGSSQLCLVAAGGTAASENRNCIQIAYLLME